MEILPYLYCLTGHPETETVLGKNSGIASVEMALERLGMDSQNDALNRELLERVKELSLGKKGLVSLEEFAELAQKVKDRNT